ncbi:hypothetical protein [Terribacillus sp. DMT04]|uniref:hypothetical protein n=1 Tax=Terribacillus sp. DMT04 TaxID=2850441 RepID=UPI001C2C2AEA|nr:hypothetical protein [Terribacillus sp. DMT04]QXE01895.1 hypothetical protein KS242_01095 [Terribacillus sp. DMT04]
MTPSEWLHLQGVSFTDIDFIETVIINQSVYEQGHVNEMQLRALMDEHFPHHVYQTVQVMKLEDFNMLLQVNRIFMNGRDILYRYKELGLCTVFCSRVLREKTVG